MSPPFVTSVFIRNYKSIAKCGVRLGSLNLLVGPNGAGKSNFLDSLRFVADALNTTLEFALRDRGGINSVRRKSRGHPTHFGIRLDLQLLDGRAGLYAFKVGAERDGAFVVQREECRIFPLLPAKEEFFVVEDGKVIASSVEIGSLLERDRLALVTLSGLPEFRAVYDSLRRMGFYNLNPQRIRSLQDPDPGQLLARDGRNLAALVRELGRHDGGRILEQVAEHLKAVVPGVLGVEHKTIGPKETIEFRQVVAGDENAGFLAENMSDGTLRALGILVAAFQAGMNAKRVSLVGIEEPEIALHPGATEVIAIALILAAQVVQVIVTTHSPDLLDHKEIRDEHILAVSAEKGETVIAPLDTVARDVLRDRLYRPGELLTQGQMRPDVGAAEEAARQMSLFSDSKD